MGKVKKFYFTEIELQQSVTKTLEELDESCARVFAAQHRHDAFQDYVRVLARLHMLLELLKRIIDLKPDDDRPEDLPF